MYFSSIFQIKYSFFLVYNKIVSKIFIKSPNHILKNIPTIIINLDYRSDRLNLSRKTLNRMGITKISKFSAISDLIAIRGCARSHLEVLKKFRDSRESYLLICEDDIKFIGSILKLNKVLQEFLEDKDAKVLCLGNLTDQKIQNYTKTLNRGLVVKTMSCYLVKQEFVEYLIKNGEYSVAELTRTQGISGAFDKSWITLQADYVFVVPKNRLVVQASQYSDILKKKVRYSY